jgi:FkbM family methyltransferase
MRPTLARASRAVPLRLSLDFSLWVVYRDHMGNPLTRAKAVLLMPQIVSVLGGCLVGALASLAFSGTVAVVLAIISLPLFWHGSRYMIASSRKFNEPAEPTNQPATKRYFEFSAPDGQPYTLLADPEADGFQYSIPTNAGFEDVPQLLWRMLQPGDTLLDLGANIGTVAIPIATKSVAVHAVDVLADNLAALRAAAARSRVSIRTYCCAIWDRNGEVSITGTSAWGQVDESGTQKVAAITIDTLIERHDVGPVTAIKMDIEGAELAALHGASGLIRREHPDIVLESNVLCYARRHSVFDLLAPLWQAGYRLYRLRPDLLCPIRPSDVQECVVCDYLATVKSDDELRRLTGYEVRAATNEELIQCVLKQGLDPPVHQLYTAAIADTLPQTVRQDSRIGSLLQEWEATHRPNELTSLLRRATQPQAGQRHVVEGSGSGSSL